MAYKIPKAPMGEGSRFKHLTATLKAKGANDPEALSSWIGRRKVGKKRFQKLAAKGK